jgi:beta-glucosidase
MSDYKKLRGKFGEGFMWGASVAAYQTDGCDGTQWAKWERANAERLAENYEKNFAFVPQYQEFLGEAKKPENYIAGDGIRHREFFEQDFDLLQGLGFNAFRFSVEWARIEPSEGEFDADEIEFIKKYIRALKKRGITPTMSLWHFTFPEWFAEKGGFAKRRNVRYFVRFCEFVLRELKDEIEWIFTINEPMVYASQSYLTGDWPPGRKSFLQALIVAGNLARAHNEVYKIAKRINPDFRVSVAQNTASVALGDGRLRSRLVMAFALYTRDYFFLKRTFRQMDFLGVNWYNSDTFVDGEVKNPNEKVSDLGWDMRPREIGSALLRLWRKYHLPMLITENGLADGRDLERKWWIGETLEGVAEAMDGGVEMLGYLHWSAFDNFEWDKGFWPRFGLIEVERADFSRKVRKSAEWYGDFIKGKL